MKKFEELEAFYHDTYYNILYNLHVRMKLSTYEIAEKFRDEMGIPYTSRAVRQWLVKYGIGRTHGESLRNRVLTGRMDYSQRELDYSGRFVDYGLRDGNRGYLWAVGLKRLLRNKGDIKRLAAALGGADVGDWKNLRHRVSPKYQELICSYFGVNPNLIFSEVATFTVPSLGEGSVVDHKTLFVKQGYRYATNLKKIMYKKGISIGDLANRLGKPNTSVSRWIKGRLVSPIDQSRVETILNVPSEEIFLLTRGD